MLASHKGEIPFVIYIVPFLAGITLALNFNFTIYSLTLAIVFGTLLISFITLNLFYQHINLYRAQWVGGALVFMLFFLTGLIGAIKYDSRGNTDYFEKYPADVLLVKVNNEPQLKGHYLRFTANVQLSKYKNTQQKTSGVILLILPADSARYNKINYGDELLIHAKFNPVDPPFNPAEFNYKQYLAQQNIYAQAFLNPKEVVLLNKNTGNLLVAYSLKLRQKLVKQFKLYLKSPEAISVASTLILGYKAELDNEILQAYSKTGTIHVLSVSGAHVAIIFALISLLLGFLDRYNYGKLFKAVITIVLIWYYSLLTGLSPAVCRAAVMISLIIIGKTYNRRINTLNILAISAFAILLFDPFLINDVGFQLSYLAVAGLIIFQPIVYNWLEVQNRWLDKLWLACSVSIAAQAITFPLSAYYFHQFPLYFLLSNLFILLPSFVIIYAGIGLLVLAESGLTVLAKPFAFILEQSILIMNRGLQLIERLPYASLGKLWITRSEYLVLFTMVFLLFCLFYYKRSVYLTISLCCLLIFSISVSAKKIGQARSDQVTFFNLKKHTAVLFKQGNRAVLLTDVADTDKNYQYSIQPCLDSSRINNLIHLALAKDTSTVFFNKKGNLLRFINKGMLIVDKSLNVEIFNHQLITNWVFVTGNPHIDLAALNKSIQYQKLIIDAGNTDKLIATLKSEHANKGKKMYVLKRNKSLLLKSD